MSSNVTLTFADYLQHILNGSPGLVICLGNGFLLLTIVSVKTLRMRKEMWMVVGLAAAHFLYGLGNFSLALYRIILMLLGIDNRPTTAWECIVLPPVFLTYVGSILVAVMNGVISIDRFIAVAWPTTYRQLSRDYVFKVLGCVAVFALTFLAGLFASTYYYVDTTRNRPLTCTGVLVAQWFSRVQYFTMTIVGFLSVVIYVSMYFAYRRHTVPGAISDQHTQIQHRLTVTLGIIVVCTLVFFICPTAIVVVTQWMNIYLPIPILQGFIGSVTRISTIISIGIYIIRQKEIRTGMRTVLRCKNVINTRKVSIIRISTGEQQSVPRNRLLT